MPTDEVARTVVDARAVAATIVAAAAAVFVLHEAATLFVPILLSVLLAYALEPFVRLAMRLHVPRIVAASLVYLAIAIAVGAGARAARDQIDSFLDDLPATIASLRHEVARQPDDDTTPDTLDRFEAAARTLHDTFAARSPSQMEHVIRVVPVRRLFDVKASLARTGWHAAHITARTFVVILFTFLLVATGDLYKRKLMKLLGRRWEKRRVTFDVIRTIDRQIERYLVVRVLISAIVATATAGGLWLLGLSHAIVWGVIAGVLNVLPIVGPTIAIVLVTVAAGVQFRSIELTAAACAIATAVAALEGNLVTPWLTSRAGELNTVAVFLSVIFWGWMWGMWGLILAVPIMVAVKAAADHIEPLQPFGELLGR